MGCQILFNLYLAIKYNRRGGWERETIHHPRTHGSIKSVSLNKHGAQHMSSPSGRRKVDVELSVGALAPASSLGAQGVRHPVHSFVEPFTCVMQDRVGGRGLAAEGLRGPRAAGPCAGRQWTRQSGTGATTLRAAALGAPTLGARAEQHDGPPERCGVGWGGARGRGERSQLPPAHP